jgi:hypothetical protein
VPSQVARVVVFRVADTLGCAFKAPRKTAAAKARILVDRVRSFMASLDDC